MRHNNRFMRYDNRLMRYDDRFKLMITNRVRFGKSNLAKSGQESGLATRLAFKNLFQKEDLE